MTRRTSSSGRADVSSIFLDAAVFCVTAILLFILRVEMTPAIGQVTLTVSGATEKRETLPLFKDSKGANAHVTFSLMAPSVRPFYYSIKVDDCLERLVVNGTPVIPDLQPVLCSPHDYVRFPLGLYLKSGLNTLSGDLSDRGAVTVGLDVRPSPTDPLMLATLLTLAMVGFWFLRGVLAIKTPKYASLKPLFILFFIGLFLRIAYVIATPYADRAHDTDAHLDYIRFVLKSWSVPHAADGWEYHQAPLYYFFAAAIAKAGALIGIGFEATLPLLQDWSLLFSLASLAVLLASIRILFPDERRAERWTAGLTVTVLPGAIYFASRITNETLSSLLSFVVLFLMIAWWKRGNDRLWYAAWAVTAVMFATKINALLFVPILIVCFLLRGKTRLKKRLIPLALTLALFAAAVSWLPVLRFLEPNATNTLTLGNKNMDRNLTVRRGIPEFLTFNPVAMAKFPFNDSWKDANRRSNFFEYFFRSAFFGEFTFTGYSTLATGILMLAYVLVLPLLAGIFRSVRHPFEWLPLHLTAGAVALIALLYATFFPYAPNQDFRQSILLLLPVSYYLADGITLFPRWSRRVFVAVLLALALCITMFIGALYIRS